MKSIMEKKRVEKNLLCIEKLYENGINSEVKVLILTKFVRKSTSLPGSPRRGVLVVLGKLAATPHCHPPKEKEGATTRL